MRCTTSCYCSSKLFNDIRSEIESGNLFKCLLMLKCPSVKKELNIAGYDYKTPLMLSVLQGDISITKVLLENNANPNYKDNHGRDSYCLAVLSNNSEILKLIFDYYIIIDIDNEYNDKTLLMMAVLEQNIETIYFLLDKGANPNIIINGNNALSKLFSYILTYKNKVNKEKIYTIFKMLHDKNLDLFYNNPISNLTYLDYASQLGLDEISKYIKNYLLFIFWCIRNYKINIGKDVISYIFSFLIRI